MKKAFQKSRIPEGKAFVIQELKAPFFDVNWHFHSEFQLFVVLKGSGTRFIGDHMQAFKEGDMVLTGPNLPHLWKNDKAYHNPLNELYTHGIVIYFPDNFLFESIFKLQEFEGIAQMLRKSSRGIQVLGSTNQKIKSLMVEMLHLHGTSSIIQLLQILELLVENQEDCQLIADAGYINTNKESEKDRMGQVYEYVMQNFQDKVSLDHAAQISNLSVSAFSRFFKSRVNKSFSDFLTDVRISHACKLLHESDLSVNEISYESGFLTLSNFNKLFKDRVKKTPIEYRKEFIQSF